MSRRTASFVLLLALALPSATLAADPVQSAGQALQQVTAANPDLNRNAHQNSAMLSTADAQMQLSGQVLPFGSDLFRGKFSLDTTNALDLSYIITPGDALSIQIWGAVNQDASQTVDIQGNVFLPGVGPVRLGGVQLKDLNNTVTTALARVFTANVSVYTNLQKPQPVAAFVTGNVKNPGRYTGSARDSALYFMDKAGGIDLGLGSFRDIRVMRGDKLVARLDLYDFLLEGRLSRVRLEDGDVIVVGSKGPAVAVMGDTKKAAAYEWPPEGRSMTGLELTRLARPLTTVSHASVSGTRDGQPFQTYLPLSGFASFPLADGDTITYFSDVLNPTIAVSVRGAQTGPSLLPVNRAAKLRDVLANIPVDVDTANISGVHILRKSVAEQQKKALYDALSRLEQSVLTPSATTVDEAQIRVHEAELVSKFVERARQVQPDGLVVVSDGKGIGNLSLEAGDVIVLPQKTDVVLISGEVRMPASVLFSKGRNAEDYVRQSGGYTDRASKELLVIRPNGRVELDAKADIGPGDQILAMPTVDVKSFQIAKDISQILYQIAIAAGVALRL